MTVLEFTQKHAAKLSYLMLRCYFKFFIDEEDNSIIGVNIIFYNDGYIEQFQLDFLGLEIISVQCERNYTLILCQFKK